MSSSNKSKVVAPPNAQELDWAFEQALSLAGTEDNNDSANANSQITEEDNAPLNSQNTPEAAPKKKKGKALAKLKQKLTSSTNNGNPSETPEAGPSRVVSNDSVAAVRNAIKLKVEEEQGKEAAAQIDKKLTPAAIRQILEAAQRQHSTQSDEPKKMADHKFWSTQPVPSIEDKTVADKEEGPIEGDKTSEDIRQEPYPLPDSFEWCTVDLNESSQLQEVYELLTNHYVEDDGASFRFDYTADFIRWALQPPDYVKEWHIGVRVTATKKLVAFIAGIPVHLRLRKSDKQCSEINYLCVHKKLRNKRLAPVLIKEVTRRCHLRGVFQAVYTAGVYLPTPVSCCQYYHRLLDVKKLNHLGFTGIPRHKTLAGMIKENAVPVKTSLDGLREMRETDCTAVANLLRSYLARFDIAPIFSDEEVRHYFYSGRGQGEIGADNKRKGQVTWSYVVEDPNTSRITDFFSFYYLPSTAIKHKEVVEAAYLFYYASSVAPGCSSAVSTGETLPWEQESGQDRVALKTRLNVLISDALSIAKKANFDVFNALTLLDNSLFVHQQKFGPGDGKLHFYLYNWLAKPIAGGTLAELTDENGTVQASPPPAGLDLRECGSGVGLVML